MVDSRIKRFKVDGKIMNPREYAEWVMQNSVQTEEELRKVLEKWLKRKNVTKEYVDRVVEDLMQNISEGKLYITKDGKKVYSWGELMDMQFGYEDTGIAELE
jgi:polyhydroxyalkanoate synthesis regulator phasin